MPTPIAGQVQIKALLVHAKRNGKGTLFGLATSLQGGSPGNAGIAARLFLGRAHLSLFGRSLLNHAALLTHQMTARRVFLAPLTAKFKAAVNLRGLLQIFI